MNKKILYAAVGIIVAFAFLAGNKFTAFDFGRTSNKSFTPITNNAVLIAGSTEKFNYLSQQRSSSCGLQPISVDGYSNDQRIQGACCSAMVLHRYQEQVEGLKQYSHISQIPEDPYDIPASLAKKLFEYQKTIVLTAQQQKIYDEAMKLSREGGPCCCKCWRWTAFEGQAKYLITEHNWNSKQIADLWDIEDGCGGDSDHHH